MTLYADSTYPVPDDLDAIHASQLDNFGAPGTWGTAAQRLAVLGVARKAGYEAGVLEEPAEPSDDDGVEIPETIRQVIRRLAVSPKDIEQDFYDQALKDGLSDAEYVEIVGLVSRITDLDVFARGIGVPLRPLPGARPGEPSRDRPVEAIQEQAWPPTVPNPPDGGAFADELYDENPKSYIFRGLSLVPDEYRAHFELEQVQYLPTKNILIADYQHHEGLTRSQVEVVAGRVSALNECFF